jgi:hypothetical protein
MKKIKITFHRLIPGEYGQVHASPVASSSMARRDGPIPAVANAIRSFGDGRTVGNGDGWPTAGR